MAKKTRKVRKVKSTRKSKVRKPRISKTEKSSHQEKFHCIVKRRDGSCHYFDEKKVYGSVYAACYVEKMKEQDCEKIAGKVATAVKRNVHKLKQVSSATISKIVVKELRKYSRHAAFMYETHMDVA